MSANIKVFELLDVLNLPDNWAETLTSTDKKAVKEKEEVEPALIKQISDFIKMTVEGKDNPKLLNIVSHDLREAANIKGRRAFFFVTTNRGGKLVIDGKQEINAAKARLVLVDSAKEFSIEPAIGETRLIYVFSH